MPKQLNFSERIARLKQHAHALHNMVRDSRFDIGAMSDAADVMLSEAQHMDAAHHKFAAKTANKATRR